MSEPKYHVGQKVAACGFSDGYGWCVVPEAHITDVVYVNEDELYTTSWGITYCNDVERWRYELSVGPHAYREKSIRPLNDDDYREDTSELEDLPTLSGLHDGEAR
jgi:hypothetical protein